MTGASDGFGGSISVRLAVAGGAVADVACVSTRPSDVARIFRGRPHDEVTGRLATVFSLCGRAQTVAALRAVERALGLQPSTSVEASRDVLVLAEMATQMAMRLCLHWPRRISLAPETASVRRFLAVETVLETRLMGGPGWKTAGANAVLPDLAAARPTIDEMKQAVEALGGLRDQLHDAVRSRWLAGFGRLPAGVEPEHGALRRHWDEPSVAAIRQSHGTGLATRLEAGWCGLRRLPDDISAALARIDGGWSTVPRDELTGSGTGTATVETARGPLTHRVTLKDGRIADYEITPPTEENFRPGGPVDTGLIGSNATDLGWLENAAGLHVLAIDPCIGFTVEVGHA